MNHISNSEQETMALAHEFSKQLKGGEIVALQGDLGSGKTTFVRGVARAFGSNVRVKSPTFTIMNEYPVAHNGIKKIIHADFYRFENPAQLEALALGDYSRSDTIVFVEWPDIFGDGILTPTYTVSFTHVNENTRKIVW